MWEGAVFRQRLSDVFGVSENHISRDFKLYLDENPNSLSYDLSRKRYLPSTSFKPHYASGSPAEYLGLLRTHCDAADAGLPGLPGPAVAETVPLHSGGVKPTTLQAITRAITDGTGLEVSYQSMRHPEPKTARLWPHALVFSGSRWHARAYNETEKTFGDFVLPRLIVKAKSLSPLEAAAVENDKEWCTKISVQVRPAGHLSGAQKVVIAQEYGMVKTNSHPVWTCELRECVVPYFLHLHRLDSDERQPRIELVDPTIRQRYGFPDSQA